MSSSVTGQSLSISDINNPHELAKNFPLCFCFSKHQKLRPERISDFVKTSPTEPTPTPVYYTIDTVVYQDTIYLAITFSLFFKENPGYTIIPKLITAGYHPGDVERVVVLFEPFTQTPKHVHFGAHGSQGVWLPFDDCEKTKDGALKVYIAPQSNATYPTHRIYFRVLCFANDITCKHGQRWLPTPQDRCNARAQSWTNEHYQVSKGINTPVHMTYPPQQSITSFQRCFLFLPYVKKQVDNFQCISVLEKM